MKLHCDWATADSRCDDWFYRDDACFAWARRREASHIIAELDTLLQLPVRVDEVAGIAVRIAFQVILVLRLGLPEIASGRELGHNLARPQPRGFEVGDCVLSDAALFLARVENRRPVVSKCESARNRAGSGLFGMRDPNRD